MIGFVKIYYDEIRETITFKFFKTEEKGGIKLKKNKESKGGWINARSFFQKYRINPTKYKIKQGYTPEEFMHDDLGKIYLVKLGNLEKSS